LTAKLTQAFARNLRNTCATATRGKVVVDTVRKTILLYKGTELYELPYEVKERLHRLLREKWKEKFPTAAC
jgi:hypothetical protein